MNTYRTHMAVEVERARIARNGNATAFERAERRAKALPAGAATQDRRQALSAYVGARRALERTEADFSVALALFEAETGSRDYELWLHA